MSLGAESQKIASVAESQREKQIAREEGKGIKGKLLLGPGETNNSVDAPDIAPAPDRAAGEPGIVDPGAPPNATIHMFTLNSFLPSVTAFITILHPFPRLTVTVDSSKSIRRITPDRYSSVQIWPFLPLSLRIGLRLFTNFP